MKPPLSTTLKIFLLANTFVFLIKGAVWIASGSAVLFSGTLHSLADVLASSFLLIGFYSAKNGDPLRYHFGRGRETFFWALMASIFTFGVASTLSVREGWSQIVNPELITNLGVIFLVLGIDLFVNLATVYLQVQELSQKGVNIITAVRRSHKTLVKAALLGDFMGVMANFVGFAALGIFAVTGDIFYDGLGSVVIGLSLAVFSLLLIAQIKTLLVGRATSLQVQKQITSAAESVKGVVAVRELRTMILSPDEILVNLEVNLVDDLDTDDIEVIMDRIRERVAKKVPRAKFIQVEVES